MKISKSRLKEIIKEEYTKFNIRSKGSLAEDANDDTFEMLDALVQAMGETSVLENLVQAMERGMAHELLQGIATDYEVQLGGADEVIDYNPSDY